MKKLKYKLAEKVIDENDINELVNWLKKSNQYTQGSITSKFEREWAKWIGSKYAVFCNSGSSANLLMAYSLLISGKLNNKKIIVPSAGWVTTISPFIQFGFEPIMCKADPRNFSLNLNHLEELLTKYAPASVICVQVLGVPGNMNALLKLKRKYKFFLLEDACAALGSEYNGKKIGAYGDMSSVSLYYGHQLSTIEGGMVTTNNGEFRNLLLMVRSHGWGKNLDKENHLKLLKRYRINNFHNPFIFYVPGFNLRSTDLNAFIGIGQLKKAERMLGIRRRNHLTYFNNLKTVDFQTWGKNTIPCSIHFAAIARNPNHRKKIVIALNKNKIETRMFSAGNLGRHPFWFERYGRFHDVVADKLYECGFFLPNNESLTTTDVKFICKVVNQA